jgi:hypothetical protein
MCVYVYVCVCVCVCMCMCMYVCVCVRYVEANTYMHKHVSMPTHMSSPALCEIHQAVMMQMVL